MFRFDLLSTLIRNYGDVFFASQAAAARFKARQSGEETRLRHLRRSGSRIAMLFQSLPPRPAWSDPSLSMIPAASHQVIFFAIAFNSTSSSAHFRSRVRSTGFQLSASSSAAAFPKRTHYVCELPRTNCEQYHNNYNLTRV